MQFAVVLLSIWVIINCLSSKISHHLHKSQKKHYYTLYSLSVFSLAKSLQLILEISATYRLVSYLLADNWLICRLHAQCMISNNNINSGRLLCDSVFVVIFFKTMYNKTIIKFGFCDILKNQGLGNCHQPRPSADNTYLDLDYPGCHKNLIQ